MAKKKAKRSKRKAKRSSKKKAKKKTARKTKKAAKKKRPKKKAAKKKLAKKKTAKKKPKRRLAKKKPSKKKTAKRLKPKPKSAGKKPGAGAKARPAMRPAGLAPSPPPGAYIPAPNEIQVGRITHYYSHLQVAVIELDRGSLAAGDTIHVKGHTTDLHQTVESMEIEHQHIDRAEQGDVFGLKVIDQVREHDVVYKVLA